MKRLLAVLRWPLWTIRTPRGRHQLADAERADWTEQELAGMPHLRNPALRRNNHAAADEAERGDR